MASHRRRTRTFSRASKPRRALLRGLVISLIEHGRIKTTVERAKETRRDVEKAITLGKKGDLGATRLLMSRFPNKDAVKSIVSDLAVRFKNRPGGYTRIIKIGRRPGDTAEMAFIEFVDHNWDESKTSKKEAATDKKDTKVAKKTVTKAKKVASSVVAAKKKSAKKIQKKSRAAARA